MPATVVPNAAQLRLIWALSGQPYAVNVIGVNKLATPTITQAIANTVGAAVKAALAPSGLGPLVGTAVTLANVGLRDIATANQPEFLDAGAPVAGTAAGDLLPPQISFVVTLRTALAGKSYRGRVYLTGFAEAANGATGQASAGTGTACVAFINSIANALGTSSMNLAVVSRPAPLAVPPRPVGMVNNVVNSISRDLIWDTQRRRAVAGI